MMKHFYFWWPFSSVCILYVWSCICACRGKEKEKIVGVWFWVGKEVCFDDVLLLFLAYVCVCACVYGYRERKKKRERDNQISGHHFGGKGGCHSSLSSHQNTPFYQLRIRHPWFFLYPILNVPLFQTFLMLLSRIPAFSSKIMWSV